MYAIDALFILLMLSGIGALALAVTKLLEVLGLIDGIQTALGLDGDPEWVCIEKTSR